jgi:hypothetical protein
MPSLMATSLRWRTHSARTKRSSFILWSKLLLQEKEQEEEDVHGQQTEEGKADHKHV